MTLPKASKPHSPMLPSPGLCCSANLTPLGPSDTHRIFSTLGLPFSLAHHTLCQAPFPSQPCIICPFPPLSLSSDLPSGYSYLWFFALVGSGRPSPQFQLLPTGQSLHGPGQDPDIHMAGKAPSQAIERG